MKIIKRYKGWKIKQTNKKDKEEGLTYEYYLYAPNEDDYPEYECDNLNEGIEFIDYCKEPNGLVSSEKLIATIRHIGREDLLNQFTATDENGNKIKGTDLTN